MMSRVSCGEVPENVESMITHDLRRRRFRFISKML
jgi:hypothetical protein